MNLLFFNILMDKNIELFLTNPWFYFLGLLLAGGYLFFKKKLDQDIEKIGESMITHEKEVNLAINDYLVIKTP